MCRLSVGFIYLAETRTRFLNILFCINWHNENTITITENKMLKT